MKPENFDLEYKKLIDEMIIRMNKPEENRYVIPDGVMIPDVYFKKDIRLAWMLKEPYDEEDGTGGGWSYFEMFKGNDLYLEQFNRSHKPTWHPMIYVSYSVHNNFVKWNEMSFIRDAHEMCDVVRNVAFINSQKLPSKNVTRTDFSDLYESIEKHSDLLIRQIDLLNPNVFIFGNTFNLYSKLLNLEKFEIKFQGSVGYIIHNEKLYISAYHPAQTSIKRDLYVDDIITTIEKWKKNQLS